jgi:hypothetical protein
MRDQFLERSRELQREWERNLKEKLKENNGAKT